MLLFNCVSKLLAIIPLQEDLLKLSPPKDTSVSAGGYDSVCYITNSTDMEDDYVDIETPMPIKMEQIVLHPSMFCADVI